MKVGLAAATVVTAAGNIAYIYNNGLPSDIDVVAKVSVLFFLSILAGSLAPDLDTHSRPSKIAAFMLTLYGVWAIYTSNYLPALPILTAFAFVKTLNHRTLTHSWFLPLVLAIISIKYKIYWLAPFSIGVCVHYACDKMNPLKSNNWIKPLPRLKLW